MNRRPRAGVLRERDACCGAAAASAADGGDVDGASANDGGVERVTRVELELSMLEVSCYRNVM